MALFAGFERAAGRTMITIDADLQNPPEEIPRLVEKAEEGYDVVATYRKGRRDSIFRRWPSWLMNKIHGPFRGRQTEGLRLHAPGPTAVTSSIPSTCVRNLRAMSRPLPTPTRRRIVEIDVGHDERKKGVSKYGLFKLLRLNFDFMTGFSLLPIQYISIVGVFIAIVGLGFRPLPVSSAVS